MKISYPLVLGRLIGLIRSKLLKGPQRGRGKETWIHISFPSPSHTFLVDWFA